MMKLAWLHDHSLEDSPGGAQLTNAAMIEAAPDWAEVVPCYSSRLPDGMPEADGYILNNVKDFSQLELGAAIAKPYIVYSHDHWDLHQDWQKHWIKPITEGAKAVIFLSPLHRDTFLAEHKVKPRRVFVVPSAIAPDKFGQAPEKAGTVWLGEFQPHKGVMEACRWAAEYGPVDFYGWGPHPPQGPGVENKGLLPYAAIPETLAWYERFLFLPRWKEPFGRTVAEAVLSGCELIYNENIGALSWGWQTRDEWARGVGEAPRRFWDVVEEALG